ILMGPVHYRCQFVALWIFFGCIHEAFGIMSIIKMPVCYRCIGNAVSEYISTISEGHAGHISSKTTAGDGHFGSINPGLLTQPFTTGHKIFYFPFAHLTMYEVETFLSKMSGAAIIHAHLDYTFNSPPCIDASWCTPAIVYSSRIWPAIHT